MTFSELLEQVRTTMLEAYANQDVPFEKIVETVVKERDPGISPLFQVMLVLRNTPDVPDLTLGNLVITPEPYEFNTVKFDLTFFLTETPSGLEGSVQYSTDLFSHDRIERMINHFMKLLIQSCHHPEMKWVP
jgi:non-ribosomal peptide synthetase component F